MKPKLLQPALPLKPRFGWGGARDRAGRKTGPTPRVRHRPRAPFARPLPAHVTLRMRAGVPSLRTVAVVRAVEKTFAAACERPGFRLVHYSLQGNHAHLVVEAQDPDALGRGMKAICARLARAVNRVTDHGGRVLADRYHVQMLPTPRQVHHVLRYVLLNARRHAAAAESGITKLARLDPASSARWFDGWRADVLVDRTDDRARDPRELAVVHARTWLLAVGWRRHGLLDPRDVPG